MTYEEWEKQYGFIRCDLRNLTESAFSSGAASRDVEVASLVKQRDNKIDAWVTSEHKRIDLEQQLADSQEQVTLLRGAVLQFRNEPLLGRAHAIRRTGGYAAMQDALDATDPRSTR